MRVLILRASVVEPWGIITAIHTPDPEKDLHIKDQAETATGKKDDLKANRPENIQDCHHYSLLPHQVPREAEHLPAGQGEVLKIHTKKICLNILYTNFKE